MRMEIASEAEGRFERKVSWGVRTGEEERMFTTLSLPAMTRLRFREREILDTLVAGGVARSRSEALAWCVRLVGTHEEDWLKDLKDALAHVAKARAEGPVVSLMTAIAPSAEVADAESAAARRLLVDRDRGRRPCPSRGGEPPHGAGGRPQRRQRSRSRGGLRHRHHLRRLPADLCARRRRGAAGRRLLLRRPRARGGGRRNRPPLGSRRAEGEAGRDRVGRARGRRRATGRTARGGRGEPARFRGLAHRRRRLGARACASDPFVVERAARRERHPDRRRARTPEARAVRSSTGGRGSSASAPPSPASGSASPCRSTRRRSASSAG